MRLIDADALTPCLVKFASDWCIHKIVFASDVEHAATIDAVPVVRCGECRFRGNPMNCPMCHVEDYYDEDDGFDYIVWDETTDEGYCQKGEREDDNE